MASERNSLKAGSFIVVSIALIIAIVVGIKGLRRFIEPAQRHQVRFALSDDIGGLADGDQVRIGGAAVGTVRDIELDTDAANPGIVIAFSIPRKFKIHKDAVLTVQSTLTGASVLNFESLGGGQMLVEGETLVGKPGASFSALAAIATGAFGDARTSTLPKVNSLLDTYKGTGESATELVKYLRSKIDPIIDRYNAVADKGAFAMNEIGSLFGDTKPDIKGTMANLNSATGSIKERMPGILEKVDGTLTKISAALDDMNA